MTARRPYTKAEDSYLRRHSGAMDYQTIADHLGRSKAAIGHRVCRLGLQRSLRRWNAQEDAIIRRYHEEGLERVAARLDRNRAVVSERATAIGHPFARPAQWRIVHGYQCLRTNSHQHLARRTIWKHIQVMEHYLGRRIRKPECVHHINGVKTDNRIENLYVCRDRQHHLAVHRSLEGLLPGLLQRDLVSYDHRQGVYRLCKTSKC